MEKEQKRRQRQQHHSSIRCHSFIFLHQPAVLCCISSSVDGVVHIIFNLTHFTKSFVCERNNFIKNTHTHTLTIQLVVCAFQFALSQFSCVALCERDIYLFCCYFSACFVFVVTLISSRVFLLRLSPPSPPPPSSSPYFFYYFFFFFFFFIFLRFFLLFQISYVNIGISFVVVVCWLMDHSLRSILCATSCCSVYIEPLEA